MANAQDMSNAIQNLKVAVDAVVAESSALAAANDVLSADNASLVATNGEYQGLIADLTAQNIDLAAQKSDLEAELDAAKAAIEEITASIPAPAPAPEPAPEPAPAPAPAPAPSGTYPNKPSSLVLSTDLDFSQSIPGLPDNVDRPIAGSNWNMIYFGNNWSKETDGTWKGRFAPGSYGGGVIGSGSGHGIGNVFTYAPRGAKRLFASLRCNFDFDAGLWHPISNKFVNIETDAGLILVQLKEGGNWRHAEELGGSSFWVDDSRVSGELHIPGQIANPPVPNRRTTVIDLFIDLPGKIFKVWQDGVLTTDAKPTFAASQFVMFGVYAFRGGGGETLASEVLYRYDHFHVAWQ